VTGDADAVASLLAATPQLPAGPSQDTGTLPGLGALPALGSPPGPEAGSASPGLRIEVLGPVPVEHHRPGGMPAEPGSEQVRALLRAPRADGPALARALHAAQAARSAHKEGGGVRVQLDPAELI
jgi:primosomal protein N' (replication factor Y)